MRKVVFSCVQKNSAAAPYRDGLPMLHLYQDIFEGHAATGSHAFTSRTVEDEDDMEDDEPPPDEALSGDEDECMHSSRFSPTLSNSSKSIKKGGSSGKGRKPPVQSQMLEALKQIVAQNDRDVQLRQAPTTSSSTTPLERCAMVLQEMELGINIYAFMLHYLGTHAFYQPVFLSMDPSIRRQWVHIIYTSGPDGPPPAFYTPPPPPPTY